MLHYKFNKYDDEEGCKLINVKKKKKKTLQSSL